jgi:hypothetical protein
MTSIKKMKTETMIVDEIDIQEDRVIMYAKGEKTSRWRYHIIGKKDLHIVPGDVIEYEPFGVNFGMFIQKVKGDHI